ncbi:serine hydrolase domain-containing protein [Pedobacter hartonius]|uniref:CubicO group peptidase, beta-lactamase class C family n=1 Tax=Pedobacter hartonius TaxID=425514 RepID=A0A1H4BI49_9SPHI|nr:serine hydrolase domain-containing protein [Pedobacter hartonius]SEA47811.1 CubicO group peptidase, beta-lactamase class C family [Pedobacter hartonius]
MKKFVLTPLLFVTCTLITILAGSINTTGQTLNKVKIDSLLQAVAGDNQAMGSLAIAHNGSLVYQKAIGYSAIAGANHTAANIKTHYRIGSISKMFTAVMVFQLIEERKITLDTKLSFFYPQIPNADTITISQMLSHRSGLYNFVLDTAYQTYMVSPRTQAEMLATFAAQPSVFAPDSKAEYSNTNFVLLGYIVENLTKKTYAEALKQQITRKLGLTDTYYGDKINAVKNEAYSYQPRNGWQQMPETDMSIPGGAGAVVSTPSDLVKFIGALFSGKLISAEHVTLMKTLNDSYGMGMFQIPFGPKKALGHNGDIDGFSSVVGYFPEEKMAYAYCANGIDYRVKDLINGVLRIYFNMSYTIPTFKTPVLTSTDLDKYLGNYSSLRIPIKIKVTKDGNTLIAQATGQAAFALKPLDKDKFGYALAGIVMEFRPMFGEFTLKQGGGVFPFIKDEQ